MDILDIFYNEIIEEAKNGKIISGFTYNVLFDTFLVQENLMIKGNNLSKGVITPLLVINDKNKFNALLIEYVNLAQIYYQNTKYFNILKEEKVNIQKNILALLWSNATIDDFSNPIVFLQKRIAFLKNNLITSNNDLGYIDILKGNLSLEIRKDEIYNETPYELIMTLSSDEGEEFVFPSVKLAVIQNTLYVYAMQNTSQNDNKYSKKVNRIFYKINHNFDEENDIPEIYGISNLKDISASFVVALNIVLNYFKSLGIEKVEVSSLLLTRWNAKRLMIEKRYADSSMYDEKIMEQEQIQHNLTEKFLRTFLRLKLYYDGLEVIAYPFEIDSSMHLDITNMHNCSNELLEKINISLNPPINSKK